ncbi:hypothetical protein VaNZ11_008683 [Volvox africanus]|uniref:Uncharacterized protein n=1 Tax=Volvox africanus TaxID=51714 RepID=A0ABQ5S5M3_9CHLO|nr:hypothetical protein VaNZ11_008683 [Volvox africanus]
MTTSFCTHSLFYGLEDEGKEGEDAEIDWGDARYRAMLLKVLGDKAAARRWARHEPNAVVVSEAYPASEYSLNLRAASAVGSAAGTLSIADLLQGLTGLELRQLGAARRLPEKVEGQQRQGRGWACGLGQCRYQRWQQRAKSTRLGMMLMRRKSPGGNPSSKPTVRYPRYV